MTLHTTLVSVFWPVLAKLSVKVGAGLAGIAFVAPVVRVVPPTLTEFSAWPCRPGATGWEDAGCDTFNAEAMELGWSQVDRGQELARS